MACGCGGLAEAVGRTKKENEQTVRDTALRLLSPGVRWDNAEVVEFDGEEFVRVSDEDLPGSVLLFPDEIDLPSQRLTSKHRFGFAWVSPEGVIHRHGQIIGHESDIEAI